MSKNLNFIPRTLNESNIDEAIKMYLDSLNKIPLSISADSILNFLNRIKRDKVLSGPYPDVSLFESANRIMTDLTILFGVRELLGGAIPELDFREYQVEFGNENKNPHDISAESGGRKLIGEAFNVSKSYFHTKKSSALKKLNNHEDKNQIILLLYNSDAKDVHVNPKLSETEFHFPVKTEW